MSDLHSSLIQVLRHRGFRAQDEIDQLLQPSLDLDSFSVPDMTKAVERLRKAIRREELIAIYADRDVDGLSGLALLARSLKTLGSSVCWGSPLKGRGLERSVLQTLVQSGAKVMILVDCGTGETAELAWLASQGMDVIIADHHRMLAECPPAYAWIHPQAHPFSPRRVGEGEDEGGNLSTALTPHPAPSPTRGEGENWNPCGAVMAFKLAEALWRTFIDPSDPERLNYFLYDHLDLVALGILADRVPLTGENRMLVWHGLRRLAKTRKEGLASLLRFFRIKGDPITVRQATWQIIPLLNAAGRLGEPHWAADLLLTEDAWVARECIDALLGLNRARRQAQDESLTHFEKTVLEQCLVDKDPLLVATARGLEPSVTGLAAQSLVQKYGRPAFLFVEQGEDFVGSGRGTPDIDLFAWVLRHQDLLVKFGGHRGAVGLTVRKSDFPALREGLLQSAGEEDQNFSRKGAEPEAEVRLEEASGEWWESLMSLEPFGPGFEVPTFELKHVDGVFPRSKRSPSKVMLKRGSFSWPAELPDGGRLPGRLIGIPQATPHEEFYFKWLIQPE